MQFNTSKSYKNLLKAFESEAVTVMKYIFFAEQAKREGRSDIAKLFDKISKNEIEHAYILYKELYGEIPSTEENLKLACVEENSEWKEKYPDIANIAKQEGYNNIAEIFQRIATIENAHEREFTEAMLTYDKHSEISAAEEVKSDQKYACLLCGYTSDHAPAICPVCNSDGPFITM